jgi:hypothetical protein
VSGIRWWIEAETCGQDQPDAQILSDMQAYWCMVHRRAWRRAARCLGFTSRGALIFRVLLGVAAVGALLLWGSEDAARDEMIGRITLAVAVLAAFPVVYVHQFVRAPAEIHAQTIGKFERLEKVVSPQVV